MANQSTQVIKFKVEGDREVVAAITRVKEAHGRLTKEVVSYNKEGQVSSRTITETNKQLTAQQAIFGKHGTAIAGLVKLWISWSVAMGVWDRTARPVLQWFKDSIKYASDANEAYNRFRVTFGGMTRDMEQWSRTSQASITQTTIAVQNQVAQLQSLFQGVGFARNQAAEMSKTMVERAIDISSFRNVTPDESFEAVRRSLLNQPRLLRGMGVPITGEIGQADMHTKTLAQYNKVLEKTAIDTGDVIRTQHQWENQLRALTAAQNDLRKATGDNVVQSQSWGGAIEGITIMMDTVTMSVGGARMAIQGLGLTMIASEVVIARMIAGLDQLRLTALQLARPGDLKATMINMLSPFTGTSIGLPPVPVSPWFQTVADLESNAAQTVKRMMIGSTIGVGDGMQTIPAAAGGGKSKKAPRSPNAAMFARQQAGLRGAFKGNDGSSALLGWLGNLYGGDFGEMQPFDLSGGTTATAFRGLPGAGMWGLGSMYGVGPMIGLPRTTPFNDFFQYDYDPYTQAGRDVGLDIMASGRRARKLVKPTGWDRMQKAFGSDAMWGIGAQAASGNFGGALAGAADIAGSALGLGPIGSIVGALFGRGGLFGKGKKDAGLTPANPIYTRDVGVEEVLTQLLNITKGQLIAGTAAGINRQTSQLRVQSMRAR